MSSYTMQLREYIEHFSQSNISSLSSKQIIENGRTKLFDFEYPIFDVNYKKVFETNFIRNFYMREIGFETEELFKFQLESWLLINMPYFNKLFESELIKFDPLKNAEMDVTHNKTSDKSQSENRNVNQTSSTNGSSTSNSDQSSTEDSTTNQENNSTLTDDNFNRHLESNNPDSRLTLTTEDGKGVIEYANKITEDSENNSKISSNSGSGTSSTTSSDSASNTTSSNVASTGSQTDNVSASINDVEDFIQHRVGKIGVISYSKLLTEYRQTLLRLEKQIFNEMNELFMLVY